MKLNELEVLQLLKDGLIEAAKVKGLKLTEQSFGSQRWRNSEKRVFYLHDYRNNLFDTSCSKKELGTGVEAVRSSAAMIFNLFGKKDFVLDNKKYTGIKYEEEFPAIIAEKGDSHNAHLDAVFHSSDNTEMYAIEAKLLEWKDSPKNLAKAYLDFERYLISGKERQTISAFFRTLIIEEQDRYGRYKHISERYDAIQMTIHALALYNHFLKYKDSKVKKLTLLNLVWKHDCDEYAKEEEEALAYIEKANAVFVPLFKHIGIDFSVKYSTFQDFKKRIDFTNDVERLEYLKRYEITVHSS